MLFLANGGVALAKSQNHSSLDLTEVGQEITIIPIDVKCVRG